MAHVVADDEEQQKGEAENEIDAKTNNPALQEAFSRWS
jgi:hypothetical protein